VNSKLSLLGNLCMLSHCWNFLGQQGNSVVLGPQWDTVSEMVSEMGCLLQMLDAVSDSRWGLQLGSLLEQESDCSQRM
jgi:hypothetical protein